MASAPGHSLRDALRVVVKGVKASPRSFAAAVLGSTLFGAATAGMGWLLGEVTDRALTPAFESGHVESKTVVITGAVLFAMAVLTALGVWWRRTMASVTTATVQAHFRRAVSHQLLRLPLSWHHRHPSGQLLASAGADVDTTFAVFNPIPYMLGVVTMVAVAGTAMVLADPFMAAIGMAMIPAVLLVNWRYRVAVTPQVMKAQHFRAEVSGTAHESFEAALVVKSLGQEDAETERFRKAAMRLRDANAENGRIRGAFDPLIDAVPNLAVVAVIFLGTWRVLIGAAEPGDVVQVAYLLQVMAFPVRSFGWVLNELPNTTVGWGRLNAVLTAKGEAQHGSTHLPAGTEPLDVEVKDVTFTHGPAGTQGLAGMPEHRHDADEPDENPFSEESVTVLRDVALSVPAGSTVAIVGPTGAGKTTLVNLLVRLVDPAAGQVLVGGQDVRDLAAGQLPTQACLVSQSTFVFQGSVRDNVELGATFSTEQVWQALRIARAEKFVRALPEGLDTEIGERGSSLSGGQRQRLALARALIRSPRLLILDDAASALDPTVEQQVIAGVRSAATGTTVVLVAYRKATISLADTVVFLENGRVVAAGTHDALMQTEPRYRHLVNAYEEADEKGEQPAVERRVRA